MPRRQSLFQHDELRYRRDIAPVSKAVGVLLEELASRVLERIRPHFKHNLQPKSISHVLKQITFILMNLHRGYAIAPDMKVAIPSSPRAYRKGTNLARMGFTAQRAESIFGGMLAEGLVVRYEPRHFSHPFKAKGWTTSTFWTATPLLAEMWDSVGLLPEGYKHGSPAERIVHVREQRSRKPILSGPLTGEHREHVRHIQKANSLLWFNPVSFNDESISQGPPEVQEAFLNLDKANRDRTRATLYRSFTGDREHGGRFFGHRLQGFPKVLRRGEYVMLGGEPIVELDFKSFNISLLYVLSELCLPPQSFDPYTWKGCSVPRQTVKMLVNSALNASSRHKAVGAINSKLMGEGQYGSSYELLSTCLDTAISRLPDPITRYFFTGFGTRAMWYESEIAFRVITKMADDGLPVVPIHDGFICQAPYKDRLREYMETASAEVLGGATLTVQ